MTTYISTRGGAPEIDFRSALLTSLAPDGGLYAPARWPQPGASSLEAIAGASFPEAAASILAPFVSPWIDATELQNMAERAYRGFASAAVAPLVRLGEDDWLLELFHGPTLAFKDIAMQLLGLLFERALLETGGRATIIGATSGDTGGAAVDAFRGREGIDVVILHPAGRISEVQRRFMTTTPDANVHNLAVRGTFDDCQSIVKALFADRDFCARRSISGVNSINWARLAIQTVYYFTAAASIRAAGERRTPSFTAPTGNFGDIFAGYAAKRMGLPADMLCVAVNANDIMHRALTTGRYERRDVVATISPSMDIQVASNFERLLFEASGRSSAGVAALMGDLASHGAYDIPAEWRRSIAKDFVSAAISEAECEHTIAREFSERGMLVDPHTAVGLAATRKARASGALKGPVVTLATAHPAKFPDAVENAAGQRPHLPDHVRDLFARPERMVEIDPVADSVKTFIDGLPSS